MADPPDTSNFTVRVGRDALVRFKDRLTANDRAADVMRDVITKIRNSATLREHIAQRCATWVTPPPPKDGPRNPFCVWQLWGFGADARAKLQFVVEDITERASKKRASSELLVQLVHTVILDCVAEDPERFGIKVN